MVDHTMPATERIGQVAIKVVGVGGGGCNAVSRMHRDPIAEVEYIAVNTDHQALARCDVPTRLRIGDKTARGLGVGGDPERGRECAEESREELRSLLQGADMVFIAAGMGGGTGTGAAPVVADVARETGALTVGVTTKPFGFEGNRRMRQALEGIGRLQAVVDTSIVIPNDRLLAAVTERLSMEMSFRMADEVLQQGVQSIAEVILTAGDINLDFADIKAVMKNAGQAWLAIGHGTGPERAAMAAESAISSPLLEVTLEGAKGIIFNITGGQDLTLQEVHEASQVIQRVADPDANIIFGTVTDPRMENEVKLTVIATGFGGAQAENSRQQAAQDALKEALTNEQSLDIPPFLRLHPAGRRRAGYGAGTGGR
jgi:cell division protein FtsZ